MRGKQKVADQPEPMDMSVTGPVCTEYNFKQRIVKQRGSVGTYLHDTDSRVRSTLVSTNVPR